MMPLDPHFEFPPGNTVTCGKRVDLPKKQRVHDYRDAGQDVRHRFDGAFRLCDVRICIVCGHDDEKVVKTHGK